MSRSRRTVSLLSGLALAAGGGGVTLAATSVGAAAATTPTSTNAAAVPMHKGTATLSLTGPRGTTHSRSLKVRCGVRKGRLVVIAGSRGEHWSGMGHGGATRSHRGSAGHRGGMSHRFAARAGRGGRVRLMVDGTTPGTHQASLLMIHHSPTLMTLRRMRGSATLNAQGGSFTWTKTLSGKHTPALKGHTVKVSETWTCSV